jgi:hypothetical protein
MPNGERMVEQSKIGKEKIYKIKIEGIDKEYPLEGEDLIGIGSEARVMRGTLKGEKEEIPITICRRTSVDAESTFNRHLVSYLIDKYYFSKEKYSTSHIPEPIGFSKKCYLYKYAEGSEGFSWEYTSKDGSSAPVKLEEWADFVGLFNGIGIRMNQDITDPDSGRVSKNIILEYEYEDFLKGELPKTWKRIDFGSRSITMGPEHKEMLQIFLKEKEDDLKKHLGWKFELLRLGVKEMIEGINKEEERQKKNLLSRYQKEILEKPEIENNG